jgi:hypothetical protein
MKKIFLGFCLGILMMSTLAHADDETAMLQAQQAEQNAINALEIMTNTCDTAIQKTKSYEQSLSHQISAIDALNEGQSLLTLTTPAWKEAEVNFTRAKKESSIATGLCQETKQLKLSEENYDTALTENVVMRIGDHLQSTNENRLQTLFRGDLIKMINRVLGAIAILFIVIIGIKYIMSMGNDEKLGNYKTQFAWLVLGLAIISLAEFVGFELLDPSGGNDILGGETQAKFHEKVLEVVRFFEYAAGAFMLINAVLAGYHLIMSGEKEETISQEKKFLQSLLMGSALILMAEIIVRILSFQDSPERTTEILVMEVAGIVNFTLSFVAILAMAMLVLSSLYFVISFGDEDQTTRAKRMIKTSIVGVIIASASYVLVRFLIPM